MATKKKIIISFLVILSTIGLIIYFVILPTIKDIKKISDDIYIERVDLETKYLKGQLLKSTIKDFEKIKPEEDKLESVFVTEGNELALITALEEIAGSYDLEQDLNLQPAQGIKNKNQLYYPLYLKISTTGKFVDILKYLKNLEQLNYYFNISSINISPDSYNLVTAALSGEIYILSSQKE